MPLFGTRGAASVTGFGGLAKLGYLLRNSLRFRASNNNYLNRTFGTPTNNKVWTWSAWVKRGSLSLADADHLFFASPQDVGSNPSTYARLVFETDGTLRLQSNASASEAFTSSAVFRDPAAWYHIVLYMDAVNTTVRCYVNGTEIAYASRSNPTNSNTAINGSGNYHRMGFFRTAEPRPMDGYMAEVNFVDGQALTPSSFGKTDPATGQWIPIKYSGTYGTNGFYLNFTDASAVTAAALGKDSSGNGNNWTPNNFSITAGATYDSMTDVPTLTSATVANYSVLNPLDPTTSGNATLSNANLTLTTSAANRSRVSSIGITNGKWYAEVVFSTSSGSLSGCMVGISQSGDVGSVVGSYLGSTANSYGYNQSGDKYNNGGSSAYGASYTNNDVIGIAFDADNGTVTFYKNNSSQGTAFSSLSTSATWFIGVSGGISSGSSNIVIDVNFGQRPFQYSAPSYHET